MTPQISPGSDLEDQENIIPDLPDSAILRPTLQAILGISEIVARSGTSEDRNKKGSSNLESDRIKKEMLRVSGLTQSIADAEETSVCGFAPG